MSAKFEGVPFHGTPPSQKNVGNTVSSKSFGAKVGNIAGQAAYYGGMAALGMVGNAAGGVALNAVRTLGPRAAVHAGRAYVYSHMGRVAARGTHGSSRDGSIKMCI